MVAQRSHYRIQYPVVDRPTLDLKRAGQFSIMNVSERGISLVTSEPHLDVGYEIKGVVRFKSGNTAAIEGKVLRTNDTQVVLLLDVGVSLPTIMEEQRWLLQKYNTLSLSDISGTPEV